MTTKLYVYEAHYVNYAICHLITARSEGEAWRKALKYENKQSGALLNVDLKETLKCNTDLGSDF